MKKLAQARSFRILISLVMVLLLAWGILAQSDRPSRVAIVPFTANAQDDITFLIKGVRDMLASRLAWPDKVIIIEPDLMAPVLTKIKPPYNDQKARQIGQELNADVVVFGSITALGKSISVDARVVEMQSTDSAMTSFMQAEDMDLVIPRINDFAQKINAEVFARPDAVAAQQKQAQAIAAYDPGTPKEEDRPVETSALPEQISPLNPLFLRSLSGVESDRYWRSPRIPDAIQSLAVDDIDNDGKNELVVLLENSIRIYRLAGDYFALTGEYKNGPSGTYLFLDIADLRGSGKPQIFVSNRNNQTLSSFVLEWTQSGLKPVITDIPYYLRVQPNPTGEGKILLGQKTAVDTPFYGPVYRMKFSGTTWVSDETVPLPRYGGNVYSAALVDLNGSGRSMIAMIGLDFTLRIFNSPTDELWRSNEMYGASNKFIPFMERTGATAGDESWWYLPTRIIPVDLDNSGRQQLIVVRNADRAEGFFERMRMFYQGTIFSLYWNGMSLEERWRTPNISGHLPDYTIADVGNVGRPALVMAVGQRVLQGLVDKETSHIVAFTLKTQQPLPEQKGL